VVLTARSEEALRGVDLGPGRAPAAVHLLDVRDAKAWERVVAAVLRDLGRLDVLVNNAGIVDPGPLESIPPGRLAELVDTNLLGAILGCRAVIPAMRAGGGGAIVHVASLGGIVPMPFEAAYAATKAGLRQLSFSLRAELAGSGIRVSVVCPQYVATAITGLDEALPEGSMPGVLTVEQAAQAVVDGLEREQFLILTHPEVQVFFQRKAADYDRWLAGMRRVRAGLRTAGGFLKVKQ
jgi:NAD(P)-dependent dehydrogenase (short-subunit alcohol dehydrogenase family)